MKHCKRAEKYLVLKRLFSPICEHSLMPIPQQAGIIQFIYLTLVTNTRKHAHNRPTKECLWECLTLCWVSHFPGTVYEPFSCKILYRFFFHVTLFGYV